MEEGERGEIRQRERAAKLRGRAVLREQDSEETAEVLMRECRKGQQTYGQSTRHESEVSVRYS